MQLAPSPAPTNASYSIPDLEVLSVQMPPEFVSLVSHVVAWFPQAAEDQVRVRTFGQHSGRPRALQSRG